MLEDESEPSIYYDNTSTSESDSEFSVEEFQIQPYKRKISFSPRKNLSKKKPCKNEQNQNSASKGVPLNIEVKLENILTGQTNEQNDIERKEIGNLLKTSDNFDPDGKYIEALAEIEKLKSEISKLKSAKFITPWTVRRKSMQSSMIKTCLFRNSSTLLKANYCPNSTRSSLFGADSSCNTIDIDDINNIPNTSRGASEHDLDFLTADAFLIKSHLNSQSLEQEKSHTNTETPLLSFQKHDKKKSRVYHFLRKLISCPNMNLSFKIKGENKVYFMNRNNRISPIPKVTLITPSTTKSNGRLFYRKR